LPFPSEWKSNPIRETSRPIITDRKKEIKEQERQSKINLENELVKEQTRSKQLEVNLIQEQNKSKQSEIEKNNRPNITLEEYNKFLTNYNPSDLEKQNQQLKIGREKLNQFLIAQKVSKLTELGNKIKGLENEVLSKQNDVNTVLTK
jgi:hypothetical protein